MTENALPAAPRTADHLLPERFRQFAPVLAAVTASVALVGFVTGIREPKPAYRPEPIASAGAGTAPPAVTYAGLQDGSLRPSGSGPQSLAPLQADRPRVFDPVIRTEEMKLAALADRAKNRAYDGAPPTIPHPVDSQSTASCLTCHGEGLKVGDRVATKISHAMMPNCTQCHVEQSPVVPGASSTAGPENLFVGVYRAGPGERASPGAPPTIPHHTWMRENCASCHGLVTRPGTRTTHPWLTNCTQCHAPSAALDRVDFSGAPR